MKLPQELQRQRVKGWRKPPNTVIVDRTSIFGNPFRIVDTKEEFSRYEVRLLDNRIGVWLGGDKAEAARQAVIAFEDWLLGKSFQFYEQPRRQKILDNIGRIKNADYVACTCELGKPCHRQVYINLLANGDIGNE